MDLNKKGWLQKYSQFREQLAQEGALAPRGRGQDPEKMLYELLQPTGLFYGHPVRLPKRLEGKGFGHLDQQSRLKLILAEGFMASAELCESPEQQDALDQTWQQIWANFPAFTQELAGMAPGGAGWAPGSSPEQLSEAIIEERLERRRKFGFWKGFSQHSILSLDVIYFLRWLSLPERPAGLGLRQERARVHLQLLRVMAAAAHTDSEVQPQEAHLFEYFLENMDLEPEQSRQARQWFAQGLDLEELGPLETDSWILRKFLFELGALTVWADQDVGPEEERFLDRLAEKLGLKADETRESLLAVEGFVLENADKMDFLSSAEHREAFSRRFSERVRETLVEGKQRLAQEILESKELVELLRKSASEDLQPDEMAKVKAQLGDLLKTIPSLAILALPGGSLLLPLLLRFLPEHVLVPSAFRDEDPRGGEAGAT